MKLRPVCFFLLFAALPVVPLAQVAADDLHLNPKIDRQSYKDDKIEVEVPAGWSLTLDVTTAKAGSYRGLLLRNGNFVLRLCTACGQVSGVAGGKFDEVAGMVQPWFRLNASGALPCGEALRSKVSKDLERVDFWYQRDPSHIYSEADNDCREPKTTDTVWYGTYFEERCPDSGKAHNCGGYLLHHDWLTKKHIAGLDEMAFLMTYDTNDPNKLPRQSDQQLQDILRQADAIVKSVRFLKSR